MFGPDHPVSDEMVYIFLGRGQRKSVTRWSALYTRPTSSIVSVWIAAPTREIAKTILQVETGGALIDFDSQDKEVLLSYGGSLPIGTKEGVLQVTMRNGGIHRRRPRLEDAED